MKSKELTIMFNTNNPTYSNVCLAFQKIIAALTMSAVYDPYKDSQDEYKVILSKIIKWELDYKNKRDLSFISQMDMQTMHDKLEELRLENNMKGLQYCEDAYYWLYNLLLLRNTQINKEEI